MTIKDLEAMEDDFLTIEQVAQVIGSGPHFIRLQARDDPEALGFPICVLGARTKIPREGFIFWAKYGRPLVAREGA